MKTVKTKAGLLVRVALLPHVRREIDGFVRDAPRFDHITMLGLQYKGEKSL